MAEYPALMWFPRDFISDTRGLSLEQRGAYRDLLDFMWLQSSCSLRDDDDELARLLGITKRRWQEKIRPKIERFFTSEDGYLTNPRLRKERQKCAEKVTKNRANAAKGGQAKARNQKETTLANASQTLEPKAAHAEPEAERLDSESRTSSESTVPAVTQSQTPKPERRSSAGAEERVTKRDFEAWWKCWEIAGTKRSKATAMKAYGRARRRGIGHETLCLGVQAYMAWCRARGDPPDKIKHPTTWLNGGCWDDELPTPQLNGADHGRLTGTSRAAISLLEDIRRRRDEAQVSHEDDAELAADDEFGPGGALRLFGHG